VMNDISIVKRVCSLPVLEPMTRPRLAKIVTVAQSCLHAALAATVATSILATSGTASAQTRSTGGSTSKEEEMDSYANSIVHKSIDIFNCVSTAIKNSSKAGGHVGLI